MFEVFARHDFLNGEDSAKIRGRGDDPSTDGFRSWLSRRFDWPLQVLSFRAQVATPRPLTVFERIVLHICAAFDGETPDAETISEELAIGDDYFVEQTLRDLADAGALAVDGGGVGLTDLGWTCYRGGIVPSETTERILSLVFDPLTGGFPDCAIAPASLDARAEPDRAIGEEIVPADPLRVDLDTIRTVAQCQGVIAGNGRAMITSAEPAEANRAPEGDAERATECGSSRICWFPIHVQILLNDEGEYRLEVTSREDGDFTRWVQEELQGRLEENRRLWAHLLGDLASPADPHEGGETTASHDLGLAWLPASSVHTAILNAVKRARGRLLMQCRGGADILRAAPLLDAVLAAAQRGVDCLLMWGEADGSESLGHHERIEHRVAPVGREMLVINERQVVDAGVLSFRAPGSESGVRAIVTGQSENRSACRQAAETFLEAWEAAEGGVLWAPPTDTHIAPMPARSSSHGTKVRSTHKADSSRGGARPIIKERTG